MRQIIALALLLAAQPVAAQFEDVTIETTHVGGQVYMLKGAGGNIGVSVGDDGVALVDDQYAPLTERILAAIGELSEKPVSFVINTHWHGDHVGGNETLGGMGAVIVAHDNVRERMSTDQFMEKFNREVPARPPAALPVVTFNDRATIHFNGEAISAHHTAHAHTDGDSIIHFPVSNVIHMGDNFFAGTYPFIDVGSGGSLQGMIAAVQTGLGLCRSDTRVIPGHGPLTDCADLESYGQMLADSGARIQELIDAGHSLDEIKARRPNAETDEKLGHGFIDPDAFIEAVYQSLTAAGH
jgi:glyoxylase-like metal-dependent hydrolase (beta-lactamase superfamily II)